jgi:hypothetical protein
MARPLVYVDASDVRDGALGQLKSALSELANRVERPNPPAAP